MLLLFPVVVVQYRQGVPARIPDVHETKETRERDMFKTRLISGIVLVALAVGTVLLGGPVLLITVAFLTFVGMWELYSAVGLTGAALAEKKGIGKMNLLLGAAYVGALSYELTLFFLPERYLLVSVIFTMLLLLAVYVFTYPKFHADQVMDAFFGMAYLALPLGCLYLVRMRPGGLVIVVLIFISSWGSDTFAYCAGVLFGKHKMSPKLSPKKSVEGAIGGIVGAAGLAALYAFLMKQPIPVYMVLCAAGALISMVGDLAASGIKRDRGIKDYGFLIPGHGGILDRFDSMLFTAPVIYFLSIVFLPAGGVL